jgi:hypothetical protein
MGSSSVVEGHVIFCLTGAVEVEPDSGLRFTLSSGQSYQIGDNGPAHRSFSKNGATLFIVD